MLWLVLFLLHLHLWVDAHFSGAVLPTNLSVEKLTFLFFLFILSHLKAKWFIFAVGVEFLSRNLLQDQRMPWLFWHCIVNVVIVISLFVIRQTEKVVALIDFHTQLYFCLVVHLVLSVKTPNLISFNGSMNIWCWMFYFFIIVLFSSIF